MQHLDHVKRILADALGIDTAGFDAASALMGSVPELDSMAVIGLIAALEDQFGIDVGDDEICARHFATVGSLAAFVQEKLTSLT
ncbi:acyl carrier protein [Massilia glaciei]|uniref:Acyl carrier protein n=1 Tax=Massilia glaciei TaxID=1524097 RepID=A0A2U2HJG1_9BURK|nr:acyl carrier protein [Massilia glaciei]PWF47659.1 acyl carrier protein [Massilia glaciei]